MTTPQPAQQPQPPQTPPGWEQLAAAAAAVLAVEEAATAAVGPLRSQLREVTRAAMSAWVVTFGSLDAPSTSEGLPAVVQATVGALQRVEPGLVPALVRQEVTRALRLGARQAKNMAVEQVRRGVPVPDGLDTLALPDLIRPEEPDEAAESNATPRPEPEPKRAFVVERAPTSGLDPLIRGELAKLDESIREPIGEAADLVRRLSERDEVRWSDVQSLLHKATAAASGAERRAAWAVNAAANQGMADVSARLDVERVWIAERDACVVCLALSGLVSVHGRWPTAATFGRHPLPVWPPGPLHGPPRHPWCRCRAEPWLGTAPGYQGPDLAVALRREAQRSILTGWRLPSESASVRLAAAHDLLERGTNLPKSVQTRARRAIALGQFGPFPRTHLRRRKQPTGGTS